MIRNHRFLLAVCVAMSSPAIGQQPTPAARPPVAADPKDVASADAIIAALYDANSVMVNEKRGADRFRSLFVPDARLMPTVQIAGQGARLVTRSVEEYIRGASGGPPRHGFSEREIARKTESFGAILQAFSTYETLRDSADKNPIHGINSIQLFNDGKRWWVVTVLWAAERPGTPIPAAYKPLDKGRGSSGP